VSENHDSCISGQIIHLTDLLAPGAQPIISNRTFERCEIRGPAMIVLMGVTLADNSWEGDKESLFRNCHFTKVGIIGTKKQIDAAKRDFGPKLLKEGNAPGE
jgi:hypothetical protein